MNNIVKIQDVPNAPILGTVTVTNSTTVSIPFSATTGGFPSLYTVTSSPSIALSASLSSGNYATSGTLSVTGSFASSISYIQPILVLYPSLYC
jgi:hypothetical protein